jgi:hypothetical protein
MMGQCLFKVMSPQRDIRSDDALLDLGLRMLLASTLWVGVSRMSLPVVWPRGEAERPSVWGDGNASNQHAKE